MYRRSNQLKSDRNVIILVARYAIRKEMRRRRCDGSAELERQMAIAGGILIKLMHRCACLE